MLPMIVMKKIVMLHYNGDGDVIHDCDVGDGDDDSDNAHDYISKMAT